MDAAKAVPEINGGIQALGAAIGVLMLPAPDFDLALAGALTLGALAGWWAIANHYPTGANRSPPAADNGRGALPGPPSAAETNMKAKVIQQAATLRQIARWRAAGVTIPAPLLERLRDASLADLVRILNTRQADALAGTPMQDVVAFLLTGRPLKGVPSRTRGANLKAPGDHHAATVDGGPGHPAVGGTVRRSPRPLHPARSRFSQSRREQDHGTAGA